MFCSAKNCFAIERNSLHNLLICLFEFVNFFQNKEGLQHMWVPLTLAGLFAYFIAHCFLTVYEVNFITISIKNETNVEMMINKIFKIIFEFVKYKLFFNRSASPGFYVLMVNQWRIQVGIYIIRVSEYNTLLLFFFVDPCI